MAKPKYQKTTLRLAEQHTWTGKPGHNVLALNRGMVMLNYPRKWVIIPEDGYLTVKDRRPPNDDCCLAVSCIVLNPSIDWSGLDLREGIEVHTEGDARPLHTRGAIVSIRKGDLDIAWREVGFVDPVEHREAISYLCLARRGVIQAFVTLDFWATDVDRCRAVWDTVLETLRVGEYIPDPRKGPWGRDS